MKPIYSEIVQDMENNLSRMKEVSENAPEQLEYASLEKRIQEVEDLSMLIKKWRKLTDTRRNLQTFSLGADGMGATVFLRDASDKEFKTSNTPVVSAVMDEIKSTLDERSKKLKIRLSFENGEARPPHFLVVNSHFKEFVFFEIKLTYSSNIFKYVVCNRHF